MPMCRCCRYAPRYTPTAVCPCQVRPGFLWFPPPCLKVLESCRIIEAPLFGIVSPFYKSLGIVEGLPFFAAALIMKQEANPIALT